MPEAVYVPTIKANDHVGFVNKQEWQHTIDAVAALYRAKDGTQRCYVDHNGYNGVVAVTTVVVADSSLTTHTRKGNALSLALSDDGHTRIVDLLAKKGYSHLFNFIFIIVGGLTPARAPHILHCFPCRVFALHVVSSLNGWESPPDRTY